MMALSIRPRARFFHEHKTMRRWASWMIAAECMTAGVAYGQSASEPAQPTIQEVVVTARRREESAQKVPIAIASITGGALEQRQIKDVSEIQFLVPTLRVTSSQQANQFVSFALRGLRSAGVVTYFSEVPARAAAAGHELYDLDSLQVLKGPQGTLFGKNTTAGAVLLQPARPRDKTEGDIEIGAGDYGFRSVQGMFNVPLTDNLFFRVAGQLIQRDGITKIVGPQSAGAEDQNSIDSSSVRASLLFQPANGFENLLILDHFNASQEAAQPKLVASMNCPANPAFVQTVILGACRYIPPETTALGLPSWNEFFAQETAVGPRNTLNPATGHLRMDTLGVSNLTSFEVNDHVTVKNIFGYRDDEIARAFDGDGTAFPLFYGDADYDYHFYSDELQLQITADRLKLIVGAFYSRDRTRADETFPVAVPSFLNPITRFGTLNETSKALYSQATYAVTDQLNLTAGFRYTWENKHFVQHDFTGALGCSYAADDPFAQYVDLARCEFDQSIDFKEPSWTFSADYQLTDQMLIYATARRGFNSGGINSSPPTAFGTEKIDDVEVGFKSDLRIAAFPVRLNLSAFHSKYADIQRQNTNFVNGQPKSFIENAAEATVEGIELESETVLGDFELGASVAYLDAKYDKFGVQTTPGVEVDVSGNKLAQAPQWTSSVRAGYHVPIDPGLAADLSANVTWAYQSTIYFEDFNTGDSALPNFIDPFNTQKSYDLWNAELVAKDVLGKPVTVSVFVKNIGDEVYSINRTSALASFGYATAIWGEPRTWGATLRYRFE
jgi:iron complex outermembrane receptor protein